MTAMQDRKIMENSLFSNMTDWLKTPLGQTLLKAESELLEGMMNRRFGYHLLQLSCADVVIHEDSPIGHKFCLTPSENTSSGGLVGQAESIPLASDSVDMVVLHHVLDYSEDPHQLLREVDRVLIAGGHLLIIGFNPFSTWGIRQKLSRKNKNNPWQANLLSSMRLCDWLKLLNLKVDSVNYGLYSLPVNNSRLIKYSSFLSRIAQRLNWPTGGIYVISALKQVHTITPIREPWRSMVKQPKGFAIGDSARLAPNNPHNKTLH